MKPTLEQLQEFTADELSEAVISKLYKVEALFMGRDMVTAKVVIKGKCKMVSFDINNWSDMGALANKHKISSVYMEVENKWCCFDSRNDENEAWHKNELRAKAIVFLMMEV